MNALSMRVRRAVWCVAALGAGVVATSCAEKELLLSATGVTKVSIEVTIIADQQVGFGPRFLVAGAGFDGVGDDEGGFLGLAVIPYAAGTHALRVPVDLAPCLAYFARRGRQACPLLIGAAIVADTGMFADTAQGEVFSQAFDLFFAGPFNIGAGGALPTVPPIDLSASRFAVVKWEGDEALRVGGVETPSNFFGAISGVAGAGTAPATLFATGSGMNFTGPQNQPVQGPYPMLAVQQGGVWRKYLATAAGLSTTGSPSFTDVAAISATEAYAAHRSGLYQFNGTGLTRVSAVTDSIFTVGAAVTAGGAKLLIAGGPLGAVWINAGQSWQRTVAPGNPTLNGGVCMTAANEAFAAAQTGGGVFRYDGANWTSVPVPNNSSGKVNLQCPAPGQAYLQAQNGQRYSWNGGTWVPLSQTGLGTARSYVFSVVSPTEMYAAGDSAGVDRAFYKFNGSAWQEVARKRFTYSMISRPWADPRGGAYFASNQLGRLERVTSGGVSVVSYNPTLRDVSMTSLTNAFVVGHAAFLARWNGARWSVDAPPPGVPANRTLRGVWTDGPSNAWAVGELGTIYKFDGTSWAAQVAPSPDNMNAVWGVGNDVWIAGNTSMLHCKPPTQCFTETTGGAGALFSVWGTSATNVFAVGAGGSIIQFRGSGWTQMTSPTTRTLYRVAGTGPNDVWAVGDSVLLRFNGTDWKPAPDLHDDLRDYLRQNTQTFPGAPNNMGLWPRSQTEAYFTTVFGNVIRFSNGWYEGTGLNGYQHTIMGIAGLTTGCALAVAESFSDSPASILFRGVGPSGCFLAAMPGPSSWP